MRKPAAVPLLAHKGTRRPRTQLKPVAPPRRVRKKLPAPAEVAAPADRMRLEMVDEYGELARQVQMFEPVQARFELLKHAIKSWFDDAPADAEASIEGKVYLLNISARQRVRKIRDIHELAAATGTKELLDIMTHHVPLGPLEELIGKARVEALVVDERSGVRRIRAVPKHPSAAAGV